MAGDHSEIITYSSENNANSIEFSLMNLRDLPQLQEKAAKMGMIVSKLAVDGEVFQNNDQFSGKNISGIVPKGQVYISIVDPEGRGGFSQLHKKMKAKGNELF